jgi:hypothetical protein
LKRRQIERTVQVLRRRVLLIMSLVAAASMPSVRADDRQDEGATLLQRVRENALEDDLVDERFSYRMLRRTYDANIFGKISNGPERLYEVGPSPADPERTWRRLVAENGAPLSADERRERDEKHRREAAKDRRKRERESPADRARRLAKLEEERAEELEQVEDVFRVFRLDRVGYEIRGSDRLLVVTLTPRDDAKPSTKWGQRMKKFRGRALVHEGEAQLVQIEMEATEEVYFGWGFIGRLHKGSRAVYRRDRLPDGTWVPVEAHFTGAGHTLLLIPFELETWAKYFDYRRLDPKVSAQLRSLGADAPPFRPTARFPGAVGDNGMFGSSW